MRFEGGGKMSDEVLLVSCTRGVKEDTALYRSLLNSPLLDRVYWFEDNTKGLSKCYNIVIDEFRGNDHQPILVFVHDDVVLTDISVSEKLQEYSHMFDVMGLAGSTKIDLTRPVIAWHLNPPECLFGAVQHKDDNGYWMTSFTGNKRIPQRTLTLDGLFIALTASAYNKIQFDNRFDFDFYDLDLCFTAYYGGLRAGVVPILVTHNSSGSGINSTQYKDTQNMFLNKWYTV